MDLLDEIAVQPASPAVVPQPASPAVVLQHCTVCETRVSLPKQY